MPWSVSRLVKMILHLMVLVLFVSALGFCLSTLVKNGNATAVIMVILGLFLLILADELDESKWNIFLNPFNTPQDLNEIVWREIIRQNRIFMGIGSLVLILLGLLNLQQTRKIPTIIAIFPSYDHSMVSNRLKSIDILRALTMLLMIFVNDLWSLTEIPVWLEHKAAAEDGMGLADVVFPAFLFIVGLSIPHAIRARLSRGDSKLMLSDTLQNEPWPC